MRPDISAAPHAPARTMVARSGRFLLLVVFLAGVGTLGVEMIASRLLAPYFGTSQPIWAVVIGLTLIYLAIGYHIGGRLADSRPDERLLYRLIVLAGLFVACIPLIADPILRFSQGTIARFAVGGFLGALFGVLVLFAAPVILLAMVSPFAVRLQIRQVEQGIAAAGATVGTISAVSTVGSIVGTFLTVLFLVPTIGTVRTIYLFAVLLVVIGLLGLRDWRYLAALVLVGLLALYSLSSRAPIKAADCSGCTLIAEAESPYNYIQVASREREPYGEEIALLLNEGLATHSSYHPRYEESGDPRDLLTDGGPWDYFAITPFFYPNRSSESIESLAILGSGAGTIPAQFLAIYGPETTIDAVEIDPEIIELGRRYFGLRDAAAGPTHPNYHSHAADGRAWLATASGTYDVIGVDAYHQPYIPFHLTTVEFFRLVQSRLTTEGVAVVNAGVGPDGDDRLGQTIAATMRVVFPQVYIIESKRFSNQIIVGVNSDVGDGWANMVANYEHMQSPALRQVVEWVNLSDEPVDSSQYTPLTDDHAPVEALIDSLIFKQVLPIPFK